MTEKKNTVEVELPPGITLEQLMSIASGPKALEAARKKIEQDKFISDYCADRRTSLACPVCSDYMNIGKLWFDSTSSYRFVCRKCNSVTFITSIQGLTPTDYLTKVEEEKKKSKVKR